MEDVIQKLIDECRRGSRKAQMELYRRYAKWIYSICLRITGNPADAEEAMQDSFLKVFTHLEQYHNGLSFGAWMQQVAVRTSIDHIRRQQPEWDELPDNYPVAEEEPEDEEATALSVAAVKEALAKLAPGYRVILSLYLFEGYDMEEISSILHIQPPSVRSQYLRGKKKLLELMKESYG